MLGSKLTQHSRFQNIHSQRKLLIIHDKDVQLYYQIYINNEQKHLNKWCERKLDTERKCEQVERLQFSLQN